VSRLAISGYSSAKFARGGSTSNLGREEFFSSGSYWGRGLIFHSGYGAPHTKYQLEVNSHGKE
jgi:hypothetical protein